MRKVCFLMAMLLFCASAYAVPEGYTPAGDGKNCYFYGENGYIVEYRYNYEERRKAIMQEYIDNYNYRLTGDQYNVYFYFINNSRSIDFTQDLSGENDIYLDLMSRLSSWTAPPRCRFTAWKNTSAISTRPTTTGITWARIRAMRISSSF